MSETLRKIPSEVMATRPDLEAEFSTSGAIDPHDHLFWDVHDDPGLLDKSQALASYLSSGRDTVVYLRDILRNTRLATALANRENPEAPVSVLEFASGYGRVSRHFHNVMPDVRVVSCDIHEHAVGFLRGLGLDACQSSSVPEDLSTGQTFDVVFVLSFFTQIPRHTWTRWIRALQAQLKPGGLLIFTANGEVSKGLMGVAELEPDGFHFNAASEQKDHLVAEYGNTVFDYVYAELEGTDLKLLQFREQSIGHHDVYVLQRQPGRSTYQTSKTRARDRIAALLQAKTMSDTTAKQLRAELAAVYASTSWRMTKSLRAIASVLRRRPTGFFEISVSTTPSSAAISRTSISKFILAPERFPVNVDDCDFYHTMDIPGYGEVKGQWDLRGNEDAYIGGIPLLGKTVLEIGPASGYLTFWMERRGAMVTAFDLSEDNKWDFVPYYTGYDMDALNADRKTHLRRLHNSWWFTRRAYGAKANVIYSTIYDIDPTLGSFEIVTLGSVLLHLRDPFRALEKVASVCSKKIVVSDVAEEQFFATEPDMWEKMVMYMLPRAETKTPVDGWYFMPSVMVGEILKILGFSHITITKHTQNFITGPWRYYTVVGERP